MDYAILTAGQIHRKTPAPMNAKQEQQYYEESEGRLISSGAVAAGIARAMVMTCVLHFVGATATYVRAMTHHFYHT